MFNTDSNAYRQFHGSTPYGFRAEQPSIHPLDNAEIKDIVKLNEDDMFIIIRIIDKNIFKSNDDIMFYRDYIHAEKVKQYKDKYFFVNDIPNVEFEIIEENDE